MKTTKKTPAKFHGEHVNIQRNLRANKQKLNEEKGKQFRSKHCWQNDWLKAKERKICLKNQVTIHSNGTVTLNGAHSVNNNEWNAKREIKM